MQDDDYARMVLEAKEAEGGSTGPSLTTWTPEVAMLAMIGDKLTGVQMTLVKANGGKPGAFVPIPRPRTALDRMQHQERQKRHNKLVAALVPTAG